MLLIEPRRASARDYTVVKTGLSTLQMFAGNCRDSAGKLDCRDFKFMRIACIPAIPVVSEVNTLCGLLIYPLNQDF